MKIKPAVNVRPEINPDPPGPLAIRKGELVATDYRVSEPVPQPRRVDPWFWAGIGVIGGFIPLLITGLIFQVASIQPPPSNPSPVVEASPVPPTDDDGFPWGMVIAGVGLIAIAIRAAAVAGNDSPVTTECKRQDRVKVTVQVDIND